MFMEHIINLTLFEERKSIIPCYFNIIIYVFAVMVSVLKFLVLFSYEMLVFRAEIQLVFT